MSSMISCQRWLVVGDVLNSSKPVYRIVRRLLIHKKQVYSFNPRLTDRDFLERKEKRAELLKAAEKSPHFISADIESAAEDSLISSLSELKDKNVEVVDLCIAPPVGMNIVKQTVALGIKKVFIQPGAESEEILAYCKDQNLEVHQSCVLRETKSQL